MVFLYALKKHKRKLKKQGHGPFVVNELTISGAVRLEMLEGAQMPNFVNGSHLKKYKLPLTEQRMTQLQKAKTYKEGLAKLKEQARKEANKRRVLIRATQQAQIMALLAISVKDLEEEVVKPFTLHLQILIAQSDILTIALINSGADCSVMSYTMWEKLGKPDLTPSTISFQSFSKLLTLSLGKIQIKARV